MPILRRLLLLTAVSLLVLAIARDLQACTCMSSGPPCQNAFAVDAVFAGIVQSISPIPDDEPPPPPGSERLPRAVRVTFAVSAAFRGVQGPTLSIQTPGSGPACGYEFKRGEHYVVYAHQMKDGTGLQTSICSRTRLLKDADEDLHFLRSISTDPQTGGRVYGAVTHAERDLAGGPAREYGGVPDVLVTLRSGGRAFDVWTDAKGRYEIQNVPTGTYELRALPPGEYSQRYLERKAELRDPRACVAANFSLRFDARVTGLLYGAAEGAQVELMPVGLTEPESRLETLRTKADADGRYEFIEVPPGKYMLGVDLTRTGNPTLVFPPTYHPGTTNWALATVLQVDGGDRIELTAMKLPAPRRVLQLTGTVRFEGRPVSGATVLLWDSASQPRHQVSPATGIRTDANGSFVCLVHEGLTYVAEARFTDLDAQPRIQLRGSIGPFVVSDSLQPLNVIVAPQR